MTDVLIITGATATGKTDCAVRLAKQYNGELISADSRQVYTGLDVISGKDIPAGSPAVFQYEVMFRGIGYRLVTYDLYGIPIWLYDVVPPTEQCSIALYQCLAGAVIADVVSRGKLPIFVGGAGLYIDAVVHPPETMHIPVDADLRKRLAMLPVSHLQEELVLLDTDRFTRMNNSDKQNPRRLVRAIEAALWKKNNTTPVSNGPEINAYWVGLRLPSEKLSVRIEKRVRDRWQHGVLDEVKSLTDFTQSLPSVSTLGIVPIREFLAGERTEEEAIQAWVKHEVAYAKRQMVWFAKKRDIHWFDSSEAGYHDKVEKLVGEWYTTR